MGGRWWVYQRERFPVLAHGPLILAFSSSALSFSALLRGAREWPRPAALVAAFVTCLLFFLQLRIADEFKDFEEDSRWRPYRPVPRGLVTLRELPGSRPEQSAFAPAMGMAMATNPGTPNFLFTHKDKARSGVTEILAWKE